MTGFEYLLDAGLIREHVPLAPFTTYKMGGPARWYYAAESSVDLELVVPSEIPVLVLGRGSNLVVASSGFPGLVIHASPTADEPLVDGVAIEAPAGLALPQLARRAAREGIGGLAFLVGIPGSVGGAVRMNAGCHGGETKDVLHWADTWDLRSGVRRRRTPSELGMRYRHTDLLDHEVVLGVRLVGTPSSPSVEEAAMREVSRWRRDHQPGGTFNAGSVFRNPTGDAAGRLIDEAGLKGMRRGGAVVSARHANFIEAESGTTPEDVHELMVAVQEMVEERTGIRLEPEIRFVGFPG